MACELYLSNDFKKLKSKAKCTHKIYILVFLINILKMCISMYAVHILSVVSGYLISNYYLLVKKKVSLCFHSSINFL